MDICECDHMPFIDKPALGVINRVKCLYKKEKRAIKKENIWALNHALKLFKNLGASTPSCKGQCADAC